MSAGFAVAAVVIDELTGQLEGDEVNKVARFLRVSDGVAQFDVEYDGRQFNRCHLMDATPSEVILFSYESVMTIEERDSDPHATYK